MHSFIALLYPLPYMCFYVTHATRTLERELTLHHIHAVLTKQGLGGPPQMRDHLNAGATSETTRTWKPIYTIHAPIHSNKANMKGWLSRPSDIRRPYGPQSFVTFVSEEKPHPGNLFRAGIEPGPVAWQARMLPPAPQRWTILIFKFILI